MQKMLKRTKNWTIYNQILYVQTASKFMDGSEHDCQRNPKMVKRAEATTWGP